MYVFHIFEDVYTKPTKMGSLKSVFVSWGCHLSAVFAVWG
jgi:hypothetical protein